MYDKLIELLKEMNEKQIQYIYIYLKEYVSQWRHQ